MSEISLIRILAESVKSPKALILAGAPASGKGTILRGLDLKGLKILNLDDEIIRLSKELGFTLNQKDTDSENRSAYMKAMVQATKNLKDKLLPKTLENKESFILDGTSASSRNTLTLKSQLEELGYEVMMLYVYVDLETSLKRNEVRFEKSKGEDRSLMPSVILRTWRSVTLNWELYRKEFKNNFVSVSSSGEEETMRDINKIMSTYIEPWSPTDGKKYDEKAQARRKRAKEKLNKELHQLLNSPEITNIIDNSISIEEAQQRINKFLQ